MREKGLWGGDRECLEAGAGAGLHQVLVSPTPGQAGEDRWWGKSWRHGGLHHESMSSLNLYLCRVLRALIGAWGEAQGLESTEPGKGDPD